MLVDPVRRKPRYFTPDEAVLKKAIALTSAMSEHDPDAKLDAGTALTALKHLASHVASERNPPAEKPKAEAK